MTSPEKETDLIGVPCVLTENPIDLSNRCQRRVRRDVPLLSLSHRGLNPTKSFNYQANNMCLLGTLG